MVKASQDKRARAPKRSPHLPPGLDVGDAVWAYVPCAACGSEEDCPHFPQEPAVIRAATARHLALDVVRATPEGRLAFTVRVVGHSPEHQFTRLSGTGFGGVLARWFTQAPPRADLVCLEGYQGIRYDVERIHAAGGADLFRTYLETLAPPAAFGLLEFSARCLGDGGVAGNYRGNGPAIDWARAFDWYRVANLREAERLKDKDGPSVEIVAALAMRAKVVARLTCDQLLERTVMALDRFDLDRDGHLAAAVTLIGLAWSELQRHGHALDAAGCLLATRLLAKALEIDAFIGRPPLFWMAVERLDGLDRVTYYQMLRKSVMDRARGLLAGGWGDLHAYVRQTYGHENDLVRIGLSSVTLANLWLDAWSKQGSDRIFESTIALVPEDDRAMARRWTIARLPLFHRWILDDLLRRDRPFWRSLDGEQRQLVAEAVARMALDPKVAESLRALSGLPTELRAVLPEPAE